MVARTQITGYIECPSLPIVELTLDVGRPIPPMSGYTPQAMAPHAVTRAPTIDEAVGQWIAVCAADGQAPTETSRKALAIKRFAERAGWQTVKDITTESANASKASMIGLKSKTIANQVCQLKRFSAFCVDQGWLRSDPCLAVKAPKVLKGEGVRALSSDEIERLLVVAKPYRRPFYVIAGWTGLRHVECRRLCWKHVHLRAEDPYLELPPDITKSRKLSVIPIPAQAIGAFASLMPPCPKPDEPVFEVVPTLKAFNADLERAGIPKHDERGRSAGIHSLRKHLATALARAGADVYTAQAMLRHADIKTTRDSYMDDRLLGLANKITSALSGGTGPISLDNLPTNAPKDLTGGGVVSDIPTGDRSRGNTETGEKRECGFDSHRAHFSPPQPPTRTEAGPTNVVGLSESERLALLRVILDLLNRPRF